MWYKQSFTHHFVTINNSVQITFQMHGAKKLLQRAEHHGTPMTPRGRHRNGCAQLVEPTMREKRWYSVHPRSGRQRPRWSDGRPYSCLCCCPGNEAPEVVTSLSRTLVKPLVKRTRESAQGLDLRSTCVSFGHRLARTCVDFGRDKIWTQLSRRTFFTIWPPSAS